jgi:hypothetical protein
MYMAIGSSAGAAVGSAGAAVGSGGVAVGSGAAVVAGAQAASKRLRATTMIKTGRTEFVISFSPFDIYNYDIVPTRV